MDDYFKIKTRLDIAQNALDCIEEIINGDVRVNDFNEAYEYNIKRCQDALSGKYDCTFSFKQKYHFLKTQESIPFLSK